ncbi:MAG TPA: prepilin-type N-terminal cleavage/methylation domain-containing protein [Noviherbaspirillum sp.]
MNKRNHGFTLIELLVAITILAIVAVLGWRGLDTIVRSRVSLTEELERTRGLQLAFAQMQSDAAQIAKTETLNGRQPLSTQAGRLTLIRSVFAENQPSRVQVVAYRLNNGVLTRHESTPTRDLKELETAWAAAMSNASTTPPVVLYSGVDTMTIRTWYENAGWRTAGGEPAAARPGEQAVTPTGLEVSLKLPTASTSLVKLFLLGAA